MLCIMSLRLLLHLRKITQICIPVNDEESPGHLPISCHAKAANVRPHIEVAACSIATARVAMMLMRMLVSAIGCRFHMWHTIELM